MRSSAVRPTRIDSRHARLVLTSRLRKPGNWYQRLDHKRRVRALRQSRAVARSIAATINPLVAAMTIDSNWPLRSRLLCPSRSTAPLDPRAAKFIQPALM